VDTKDELRPAFYNALGNTVVARNMDHAAEIAYAPKSQLRKVVTLKVRPGTCLLPGHLVQLPMAWCVPVHRRSMVPAWST
jgi:hypothetical protein